LKYTALVFGPRGQRGFDPPTWWDPLGFAGVDLPVRPGCQINLDTATMTEAYSVDIDQCAHCGLVLGEDRFLLLYCGDCGFEYCSEHASVEHHDCSSICAESGATEEAELALSE